MTRFAQTRQPGCPGWQVVVVDDCSTDNTAALAERSGAMVVRLSPKAGLAEVFRQEVQTALNLGADWIVHMDSDGQHPAESIPQLLSRLESGADLVIGSRFLNAMPAGKPFIECFESRSFSRLLSWITGCNFTDVNSGFRAFSRRVAQEVPIRSSFSYTREQILRAAVRRFQIEEVSIASPARQHGNSRLIKNRYHTMFGITRRFCVWSREERLSPAKIPVILAWGIGTIALSRLLRCCYRPTVRPHSH